MEKQGRIPGTLKIKKLRTFIVSGLLLMVFLTPTILIAAPKYFDQSLREEPLILNSDLTAVQEAVVRYFLWTEDCTGLLDLEGILRDSGLAWQKEVLKDFSGNKALKYTAQIKITKEEEGQALDYYHSLYNKMKGLNIQVYFEEKVNDFLDPVSLFYKYSPDFYSRTEASGVTSWTGFHPALPGFTLVEGKKVNFQLLTVKGSEGTGKTLLAVPALLEDF